MYERINLNDPVYRHVKAAIDYGLWACDSIDHNESDGCSNPECFKHSSNQGKEWHPPTRKEQQQ